MVSSKLRNETFKHRNSGNEWICGLGYLRSEIFKEFYPENDKL